MSIVVVGEPPTEIESFMRRRQQLGLDGSDEMWGGVYHVVPHAGMRHARVQRQLQRALEDATARAGFYVTGEFNLGGTFDYRVPDLGVHADDYTDVYVPSAILVGEVISPGDETWAKFDFYAERDVEEILVADPLAHSVRCFQLGNEGYTETSVIICCGLPTELLAESINWP